MAKLTSYTFLSLNGYYKGLNEDISWHRHGEEEAEFSAHSLQAGNMLLFGRVTYELMEAFWPTEEAMHLYPIVAEGMNRAEKIVFSRTLEKADWDHARVVNTDMITEIRRLKQGTKDMTLLGSGDVLRQLAEHDLLDEYLFMIDPVAITDGVSVFTGMKSMLHLNLVSNRVLKSGTVLLTYHPVTPEGKL